MLNHFDAGWEAGQEAALNGLDERGLEEKAIEKARHYAESRPLEEWAEIDYYDGFITGYESIPGEIE